MNHVFSDLFIFELANNHQGRLDHGLRIIEEMAAIAKRHGIKAGVKFQYRDLDTMIHPAYRARADVPHVPRFLATRLSDADFRTMVRTVHDAGLVSVCTPFDEVSVQKAVDHDVAVLKVASCSADDWPLLDAVASAGRPVIISTGGLSWRGIDSVARFAAHRGLEYALLHCVAVYPCPSEALNLGAIARMARRYPGVSIGYSGHEAPDDLDAVQVAVSQGASILERHVGLEAPGISLNAYSLAPSQVDAWVRAALAARTMCGTSGDRHEQAAEQASLRSLKRGVYALRAIARGSVIAPDDVMFAMPCVDGQLTAGEFSRHRATFIASRDYARLEAIAEPPSAHDVISFARDVLHEAQGMIHEAGVAVGDDVQVELSHHFGLARFREVGAVLINVIDREYCKKLVVLLPGQEHPAHYHKVKEETFQVLWGELEVIIGSETRYLRPGDKLLVHPGAAHAFKTRTGAIFEEISTRSTRNDSYYLDERIRRLDPMERKTVLDAW